MENGIENQQLNITYEQLLSENERLMIENEQLKKENEQLENEIEEIASEIEQLVPMSENTNEEVFTICEIISEQKEAVVAENRKAIISAIAAATCTLGFIISLRFGVNIEQANQLQFESLNTLGKYFEEIGPLTAILQTSAVAFYLKTFVHEIRKGTVTKQFGNFRGLEGINTEEEKNARRR